MSGGRNTGGYTIVEVMMFLAISGALFVIAAAAISGKQEQAQFAQSIRDFQAKILDISNDISTGYFPGGPNYSCQYGGGVEGQPIVVSSAGTSGQGTHEDCIFLGKVLHFTYGSPDYSIISVGGGRTTNNGILSANMREANPEPIVSTPDLTEITSLANGLAVTGLIVNKGGTIEHPASLGIFTSLPQYNSSPTSGSLTTNYLAIPGSVGDPPTADDVNATTARIRDMGGSAGRPGNTPYINPVFVVCVQLGKGGKRAALVIGASDRQNAAELKIDNIDDATTGVPSVAGGQTCPALS